MSGRAWTEAEDDAARRLYPVGGPQAALAALPGRTLNAVHVRAHLLGCTRRPHWTASEDDRLRLLWGDGLALPRIARELQHSPAGVYERACTIGLPLGCPQGWEYISHAAARVGYHPLQLRRILRAAGVRLAPALALPARGRSHPRARIVDPVDVDNAVAAWLATEPAERAARRRGHCGQTLRHRLRLLGLVAPSTPSNRRHYRVTEAQVQAAFAIPVIGKRLQPQGEQP